MYYELTDCVYDDMLVYVDGKFINNPGGLDKRWCVVTTPKLIKGNSRRKIVNLQDMTIGFNYGMTWIEFIDVDNNYRAGFLYELFINEDKDVLFHYSGGSAIVNQQYPVIIES